MTRTSEPAHLEPDRVWPVVVIGAGAAGLIAAIFAAGAGASVLLLETRTRPGAKIRISGGGRCNVLPSTTDLDDFHTSGSQNTMRNILFSWPLEEVRRFFEQTLKIPLKTEPTGKVFPVSDDAREVVTALLDACTRSGAVLRAPGRVTGLRPDPGTAAGFVIEIDPGEPLRAKRVIVATGGLSLPKSGSDGRGMAIAESIGHTLVPTHPALVPLLTPEHGLSGLSSPVRLTAERSGRTLGTHEGSLLFTHRGVSGPVVLDASHHLTGPDGNGVRLFVRWGPASDWNDLFRRGGRGTVSSVARRHLPQRLIEMLLSRAVVDPAQRLSELTRDQRERVVNVFERTELPVTGNEGYRTAEVTGGGIPLSEIRSRTLESRLVPGLYFCGEILDVTGRLGGYNFLWAWVSGRKAGIAAAADSG